ncbi:hypothetical protein RFI_15839 [Reticulomyxa filosa]|uniref:Uncharacterized protein n=1 Tax=Reticulomyxa filosa TaxID=46433 RepID=X6N6K3_RETFI|nr:hypothetical protein RFI_15839 [Reticulomyxa filosa]|eukprot:ETO21364.1 hypothetical protein RFI_15839 [Reticulomyxa filosa]
MGIILPAYFIAELYWILVKNGEDGNLYITHSQYIVIFVLFVVVRLLCCYWSILCILNFGKGLKKEKVFLKGWSRLFMPTNLLDQVVGAVGAMEQTEKQNQGLIGKAVGAITRIGVESEEERAKDIDALPEMDDFDDEDEDKQDKDKHKKEDQEPNQDNDHNHDQKNNKHNDNQQPRSQVDNTLKDSEFGSLLDSFQ